MVVLVPGDGLAPPLGQRRAFFLIGLSEQVLLDVFQRLQAVAVCKFAFARYRLLHEHFHALAHAVTQRRGRGLLDVAGEQQCGPPSGHSAAGLKRLGNAGNRRCGRREFFVCARKGRFRESANHRFQVVIFELIPVASERGFVGLERRVLAQCQKQLALKNWHVVLIHRRTAS